MSEPKASNGIIETIKTVVYALLIAGVFRTLFFQPFWIPSGSMKDTLYIGDFLFVNKMAYGYSYASCPSIIIPSVGVNIDAENICGFLKKDDGGRYLGGTPERGDVAVFRHPGTGRDFIKRIVGMGGDRVQVKSGVLHINDTPVKMEPTEKFVELAAPQGPFGHRPRCSNGPVGDGASCEKSKFLETFPDGHSHYILDIGQQGSDDTPVYVVPEGHFFMMGDNRDNSSDSRVPGIAGGVGFVPFDHLIGRADRIVLSSGGRSMLFFWTWRGNRFFKKIQ